MAAPKYLARVNGVATSRSAAAVGGASSIETVVSTNTSGVIDASFLPAGIGMDIVVVPASEALSAGAQVNLYQSNGTGNPTNARNADSATGAAGKRTDGFVLTAVASGNNASVYRSGMNTALTGLTPGLDYWMGASGAVTSTIPPETAGTTAQRLGKAVNATTLDEQIEPPVAIAA